MYSVKIKLILFLPLFINTISTFAQVKSVSKSAIDTASFFNWPRLSEGFRPSISNDGRYALYGLETVSRSNATLTLQELATGCQIIFPGIYSAQFTDDSKKLIYQTHDSLCIMVLSNKTCEYITPVRSFRLFTRYKNEWLSYQRSDSKQELLLRDLNTANIQSYNNVLSYTLSNDNETMVVTNSPDPQQNNSTTLSWVDLSTGKKKEFWTGKDPSNLLSDLSGKQWVFMAPDSASRSQTAWLYQAGNDYAQIVISNNTNGIKDSFELASLSNFSKDGGRLFFAIKSKPLPAPDRLIAAVNIWSYKEPKPHTVLIDEAKAGATYFCVTLVDKTQPIKRLQQENEIVMDRTDDYILVNFRKGLSVENYWNSTSVGQAYLVFTSTGDRKALPFHSNFFLTHFSAGGRFVIGTGPGVQFTDIFAYDILNDKTHNLTSRLSVPFDEDDKWLPKVYKRRFFSDVGWMDGDKGVLLKDQYDIWLLDPSGKRKEVNLTNGRTAGWQFQWAQNSFETKPVIESNTNLLLQGFNKRTKESGFFRLPLTGGTLPKLLYKGSVTFTRLQKNKNRDFFLKARDSDIFLVKRESCSSSPNLYQTANFINFAPVTHIDPEHQYNWMTSELLHFKTVSGKPSDLILYKPENFNPKKKYPVIFHYYEQKSDELNQYQHPIPANGGDLDIAWFVSHGYLVALVDIHYTVGYAGRSAQDYVEGAAKFLGKFSFADSKHMGLQGHSYGAWETNYLVTHSKLFAAGISSCGVADMTTHWTIQTDYVEGYGYFIGATPWQRPDLYVENSPIYSIGRVQTPVLLMANPHDPNVPQQQGLAFFSALRRAHKPAWLLQYDHGDHGVGGVDYQDYLRRSAQFFDHYLKGAPAPIWMTCGIPASQKCQTDGFAYDTEIKTPGKGLN